MYIYIKQDNGTQRKTGRVVLSGKKKNKYFRGNGIYIFIETHRERQRERKGEWEREK